MAPLPSLARLSLRPAPVGQGDDEPLIYRRFMTDNDGNITQQALRNMINNGAAPGPSNAPDDDDGDVVFQEEKTREQVEADKKRKAKANGDFIELSDSDRDGEGSPVTSEPQAMKREGNGNGKGKQPAKRDPNQLTPDEVDYDRRQLDQEYTLKQQEAINYTTRATTAFLNGDVDDGLGLLAQARFGERMKELKANSTEGGRCRAPRAVILVDVPTGIRTLAPSRAAAAGPSQPSYRSGLYEMMEEARRNGMFSDP